MKPAKNLGAAIAKVKKKRGAQSLEGPKGTGGKAGKRTPQKPYKSVYQQPTFYDSGN